MPLSFDNTIRNNVCLNVYGEGYDDLSADKQANVDAEGGYALTHIRQYAQWFEQAGSSSAPDQWAHWLDAEAKARVSVFARPDRADEYRSLADRAMRDALRTFNRDELDANLSSGTAEPRANYSASIRNYIVAHLVRRDSPKFIPTAEIDSHISDAVNFLWNKSHWIFRTRQAQITVTPRASETTHETVAINLGYPLSDPTVSGIAFDALHTRKLYYESDTANGGVDYAEAVSADQMRAFQSKNDRSEKPRYFRIERLPDSSYRWWFYPRPDRSYSFQAEVAVTLPSGIGNGSSTSEGAFSVFPAEFREIIRKLALVNVLQAIGDPSVDRLRNAVMSEIENHAPAYTDTGNQDSDVSVRDYYGDLSAMGSFGHIGGNL